MKKNLKKWLAAAAGAALCMALLSGCGGLFSAKALVQGNLDLVYLNQYTDEYLKSVNLTAEEAAEQYEAGIAVEVGYFVEYFNIELDLCDDSIEPQITELYHEIYDHSKYEVGEETKNDDYYLVELTVYPIDIMQKVVEEDAEDFVADMQDRYMADEFTTEEEYETAWAQGIIDLVSARLDSIGYLEPETISVQVGPDSDGVYCIADNDFTRIDGLIISY